MFAFTVLMSMFADYHSPVINDLICPALRQHWVSLGVMEDDEWYFRGWWNLEDSIEVMQWRFENIKPETPPIEAKYALPTSAHCYENLWWCRTFLKWIEQRRPYAVGEEVWELDWLQKDTEERQHMWGMIAECRSFGCGRKGRRLALEELRTLVGEDVFYSGRFPNPMPDAAYSEWWELAPKEPDED